MYRPRLSGDVLSELRAVYGDRLDGVLESLGRPCSRYTLRVNTLKCTAGEVVDRLRSRGLKAGLHEALEEAIYIEVEGPNRLPYAEKAVVADKYAAESVMQGAHLYAPGVKRAQGVRRGDSVLVVDKDGRPVAYGVAEMGEDELRHGRVGVAVRVLVPLYSVPSIRDLEEHRLGLVFEQSLPAMVASRVLDPQPGETIVDMCAAPGGKTGHIVQLLGNRGRVVAVDRSARRLEALRENMARLGAEIVSILQADARYLHVDYPSLKADRVLVDPPCTALGVRPKLYDEKTMRDVWAAAEYQRQFLRAAREVVKPGGVIVYSTCTLTPQENEMIVSYAVEELGLELEDQPIRLGSHGLPIVEGYEALQRFYPDVHDTPGFFIARFRRRG